MRLVTLVMGLVPVLCLFVSTAHAQRDPIKWGDIPDEHLQMTAFPADTNAAAVVLADYGTVRYRNGFEVVFERHRRIKILSEAAYDEWGTHAVTYYAHDRAEKVRKIRGQTFVLDANGKVQRHTLDKKSIFTEDLGDGFERVKFTLPALAPGAVIEYRYIVEGENPLFMPSWQFQASEPVLWSEFRAEIPDYLSFVRATKGVLAFFEEETIDVNRPDYEGKQHRWVMRDVEALRTEPFMTTPNDYRANIDFQLHSYRRYDGAIENFMNSWPALAKELMDMNRFGKQLDKGRIVRDEVEAATAGLETDFEKMVALYDYVRSTIAWDGKAGFIMGQDLDDILKTKSADSPGVALLLVAMLREAGIEAHPVLISTRSHGQIIRAYPLLNQFNDVLAYAKVEGKEYLMDACDPLRPYDLLPYESLNVQGWLVREKNPTWVAVQAPSKYRHQSAIMAELSEDGTITGTLSASDAGYSAYFKRGSLKEAASEEDFVRDVMLDGLEGMELTAHTLENVEETGELLRTEASFTVPMYAQAAGDFIYLNPMLIHRMGENPLRLPERTFPVDLGYARTRVYTLRLTLPDGYEPHELPQNRRVHLPSGGATFQRFIQVGEDGAIEMNVRLTLSKAVFEPRRYAELRQFYEEFIAVQAEQIVLRRASEEAAAVEVPAAGAEGGK